MLFEVVEIAADAVSGFFAGAPLFIGGDDDIALREALAVSGVIAAMLVFALALSSWIVASAAVTLPWMIGERLRHARRRYGGRDGAYETHQHHFYIALAVGFSAVALMQLAEAYLLPPGMLILGPALLAQIPDTALAHASVAVAFPTALLALWYVRNRSQAVGGGLIAAAVVTQALDQILRGGSAALGPGHIVIAQGIMLLGGALLGLGFAQRKNAVALRPTGNSAADLRRL